MKVLLTGGGTGGHVNPAIAIADTFKAHDPSTEFLFVGTSRGIENKLVPKAGYELAHIEIRGLRRSLSLENLKTVWLTLTSVSKAKKLLRKFKPDIVIGTGGYACFPACKAAAALGIPVVLHEANAIPGIAVRLLEHCATTVFLNFDESRAHLKSPDKAVTVGNPLRSVTNPISYDEAREALGISHKYRRFILSYGGSMGAERINFAMLDLMKSYSSKHPDTLHVHATGAIEYEATKAMFTEAGLDQYENIKLLEYIYDMPMQMAAADVVISRAGSMTLSELALAKKACILIPSPNVTDNHQYKNAKVLSDRNAAILIEEKDITKEGMHDAVATLLSDTVAREAMQDAIGTLAMGDAAERIYAHCMTLIKG